MKDYRSVLEKHLGPKCDTYEPGCITCEIWEVFEKLTGTKDHLPDRPINSERE